MIPRLGPRIDNFLRRTRIMVSEVLHEATHTLRPALVNGGADTALRPIATVRAAGPVRDVARVQQLMDELMPIVSAASGLPVDPLKVTLNVVPREAFFELCLDDLAVRNHTARIDVSTQTPDDKAALLSLKAQLGGVYLPSSRTLGIPEDFALTCTDDDLKELIFHELVHVGQHQNHPRLFDDIAAASAESTTALALFGADSEQARVATDRLNARMAFLEGHPTYLQVREAARWPSAAGYLPQLSTLLKLMMNPSTADKMMQYALGNRLFKTLDASPETRTLIHRAYENTAFIDVLLRTQGTIEVPAPTDPDKRLEARLLIEGMRSIGGTDAKVNIVLVDAAATPATQL